MKRLAPQLMPIAPSCLPCVEAAEAWRLVLKYMPDLPGWPRLPRRSFLEDPVLQLSEGFPGAVFEGDHIHIDGTWDTDPAMDELYIAYLGNHVGHGRMSSQYASCLDSLVRDSVRLPGQALVVKGQLIGPLSWSERVLDQNGRPILYDEVLLDAAAKHLRLKAAWQESALRERSASTLVLVEDPLLGEGALADMPFDEQRMVGLIEEVLGGLSGWRGVHCTWPIRMSVLAALPINVLSLDVPSGAEPNDEQSRGLRSFVAKGGLILWCIVPANETPGDDQSEVAERLDGWLRCIAGPDHPIDSIAAASMVAASSNLASVSVQAAERALAMTKEVSRTLRTKYS